MSEFAKEQPKPESLFIPSPQQERFLSRYENSQRPYLDINKVQHLPEFKACAELFDEAAKKYSRADGTEEASDFISNVTSELVTRGKYRTFNSSVYGRKENAQKLADLFNVLGFKAQVIQVESYGDDESNYALVVEP